MFRSSLICNTTKSLGCAQSNVDGLKRATHVLWLLHTYPVTPQQTREGELHSQLATEVLNRFRSLWLPNASRCVVVPPPCMLLAARMRSLMPTSDLKSAVDHLVGCCELPEQAAGSAASSSAAASSTSLPDQWTKHELTLRLAAAVSPNTRADASTAARAFGPVAFAILRLRATELRFRERLFTGSLQPSAALAAAAAPSAALSTSASMPPSATPPGSSTSASSSAMSVNSDVASNPTSGLSRSDGSVDLVHLIERLLREARELLDYYSLAFQTVALPNVHSTWEALKQKGIVVPVMFPCVPLRDALSHRRSKKLKETLAQLSPFELVHYRLLEYLEDDARFGCNVHGSPVRELLYTVPALKARRARWLHSRRNLDRFGPCFLLWRQG